MKFLRNSVMVLMLAALGTIWSCGGGDDPTPLELINRITGTWVIESAQENGSTATFDTAGFSITLGEDGRYSISLGSLPVEYKPNYASAGTSGAWSLVGSNQIVFDGNSVTAISISNLLPSDNTQLLTNMTVSFTLDDKNSTSITFDLIRQ